MDEVKILIGWSGDLARQVAPAVREWLKFVIPDSSPWFSDVDIPKGSDWRRELHETLAGCAASVIIVTQESINSPWLLFEAGAASMALGRKPCCTILIEVAPSEVHDPLATFMATEFTRSGFEKLASDLNSLSSLDRSAELLAKRFDQNWPDLEGKIRDAVKNHVPATGATKPTRKLEDLVKENLLLTRSMRTTLEEVSEFCSANFRIPATTPRKDDISIFDLPIGALPPGTTISSAEFKEVANAVKDQLRSRTAGATISAVDFLELVKAVKEQSGTRQSPPMTPKERRRLRAELT